MTVILLGLNHKTAPLEVREKLAFSPEALPAVLERLPGASGVREGAILSTCNRTEIYAWTETPQASLQALTDFVARSRNLEPAMLLPHLYQESGLSAITHLFEVASGLDSMIIGENQVLGQVRKAWQVARDAATTGPVLDRLFPWALRVGRQARTQTHINQGAASVSHAAVEMARQVFGDLTRRTILVLGAGKMSELTLKHLVACGARRLTVANRTDGRARQLARRCGVHAVPFEDLDRTLEGCDIMLTSTGAPHYVVTRARLAGVMQARPQRPLFLVDIALPRDVEPSCGELPQVHLYNLDDLQRAVARNLSQRHEEVAQVAEMVRRQSADFVRDLQGRQAVPAIRRLRQHFEDLRQEVLERARLPGLSPRQARALEIFSRRLVARLLHRPTVYLRELAAAGATPEELAHLLDSFEPLSPREPAGDSVIPRPTGRIRA